MALWHCRPLRRGWGRGWGWNWGWGNQFYIVTPATAHALLLRLLFLGILFCFSFRDSQHTPDTHTPDTHTHTHKCTFYAAKSAIKWLACKRDRGREDAVSGQSGDLCIEGSRVAIFKGAKAAHAVYVGPSKWSIKIRGYK